MLKLYSERKARRIIAGQADWIGCLSRRYPIPAACIRAILFLEITEMDLFDVLADLAVAFYWLRYRLRRALRLSPPGQCRGIWGKRDSSTGYAQIFAYVAIRAINFAAGRGLADYASLGFPGGGPLRPDEPEHLRAVWTRLRGDTRFNLECAALNLLSAAEEMTGRIDFPGYSPGELKLVLTRYNADVRSVTAYGEKAYRLYLSYGGGDGRGSGASQGGIQG